MSVWRMRAAGDDVWTVSSWKESQLYRALGFQGKLYVVNWEEGLRTRVSQINPPPRQHEGEDSWSLPEPRTIVTCSSEEIYSPSLVELDFEIMLLGYNDSSLSHILILRLADLAMGRTAPVRSIGDHFLVVSARSLDVSSSWLPSIGGNSIFIFHAGEKYLAQYHLSTGTWSSVSAVKLMLSAPPRPSLMHHILTCCYPQFWSLPPRAPWERSGVAGLSDSRSSGIIITPISSGQSGSGGLSTSLRTTRTNSHHALDVENKSPAIGKHAANKKDDFLEGIAAAVRRAEMKAWEALQLFRDEAVKARKAEEKSLSLLVQRAREAEQAEEKALSLLVQRAREAEQAEEKALSLLQQWAAEAWLAETEALVPLRQLQLPLIARQPEAVQEQETPWDRREVLFSVVLTLFIPVMIALSLQAVFTTLTTPVMTQQIILYFCGLVWAIAGMGSLLGLFSKEACCQRFSTHLARFVFLCFCLLEILLLWYVAPAGQSSDIFAGVIGVFVLASHLISWIKDCCCCCTEPA